MKYSYLSDDAINMEVTEKFFSCEKWDYNEKDRCFFYCGIDGSGYYSQQIVDFCNNPSDAWPIIVENEIDLIHNGLGCVIATDNAVDLIEKKDAIFHQDKNPLRAAMIVFLMMNEGETK